MIISTGRKYIFVHIPKTGGTALSLALEQRAMADDILIGDTPKAQRRRKRLAGLTAAGRMWKHSTLADIDGVLSPDAMAQMYVVTLVRNPWDRMVSYYHWLRMQTFDHPAVGLAKSLEFSPFLNTPLIQKSIHDHPYGSYVTDASGHERCDLFIRLEHFDDDVSAFEGHLGFSLTPLAVHNPSNRARDWHVYFDDADRELVANLCAPDIKRFGYSFDGRL